MVTMSFLASVTTLSMSICNSPRAAMNAFLGRNYPKPVPRSLIMLSPIRSIIFVGKWEAGNGRMYRLPFFETDFFQSFFKAINHAVKQKQQIIYVTQVRMYPSVSGLFLPTSPLLVGHFYLLNGFTVACTL